MVTNFQQSLNQSQTLPPLENGDRLTRLEFERRYQAMPSTTKQNLLKEESLWHFRLSELLTPSKRLN